MEEYSSSSLWCVNGPCAYTFIRTYIHTCIQTYIQTYIHTCMHAYVCVSVYVYKACWTIVRPVRAVEFKGMCDGVYTCTHVFMHVCICMCLHGNMYINSLIHIHVFRIIYTHIHPPTLSLHPAQGIKYISYIDSLIHIHVLRITYTLIHPPTLSLYPAHQNQIYIIYRLTNLYTYIKYHIYTYSMAHPRIDSPTLSFHPAHRNLIYIIYWLTNLYTHFTYHIYTYSMAHPHFDSPTRSFHPACWGQYRYGVATTSRLLKIVRLFCWISSLL